MYFNERQKDNLYVACYVETCFYHVDKLGMDNPLNPQYICSACAKILRCTKKQIANKNNFKRQKTEKKFLPKFARSPTDCDPARCHHMESDIKTMKIMWMSLELKNQCIFIEYLMGELRKIILQDVSENIQNLKENGQYTAGYLKNIDLKEYLHGRDKRIITLILTLFGKNADEVDGFLAQIIIFMECLYFFVSSSVMPFRLLPRSQRP